MCFMNIRLRTLIPSVSPVVLGTALAFGDGIHNFLKATLTLFIVVLIHMALLLLNRKLDWAIKQISYPLFDVLVFLITGPLIVSMTYHFQSNEIHYAVILLGFIPGFLTVTILDIQKMILIKTKYQQYNFLNNLNIFTYQSRVVYYILIASLVPILTFLLIQDHLPIIICSLISLMATPALIALLTNPTTSTLNQAKLYMEKIFLLTVFLISICWII